MPRERFFVHGGFAGGFGTKHLQFAAGITDDSAPVMACVECKA